jgi:antitoxin component YwqK of YwqJK toxin-antitoxin module
MFESMTRQIPGVFSALLAVFWLGCGSGPAPLYNRTDSSGLKQGVWQAFDEAGNLRALTTYVNDRRYGRETTFYPNGDIYSQTVWKSDSFGEYYDSLALTYHPGGRVELQAWYDWGEPVGTWKYYYPDGTLRMQQEYAAGRRSGVWRFYRPNGSLELTVDYAGTDVSWVDETKNGTYIYHDARGDTLRVELWLGGQLMNGS